MSDDEFELGADEDESPLSELPPLAAAAVAADLASCRISPAGGPSSTPAPPVGICSKWRDVGLYPLLATFVGIVK